MRYLRLSSKMNPLAIGTGLVALIGCYLILAVCALSATPPRLKETTRYDLRQIFNKYPNPSAERPPIDISLDQKYIVTSLWHKGVSPQCRYIAYCGDFFLGLIDVSSGRLSARTAGDEAATPAFAFFRQMNSEIVTNSGTEVDVLDGLDLHLLRRITGKAQQSGTRSRYISAALSSDENALFIAYFDYPAAAEHSSQPIVGRFRFEIYDLAHSVLVTSCASQVQATSPYFQIAVAPGARSFLFGSGASDIDDNELFEYDSQTCSALRSWNFDAPPTHAQFSPDGKYIAIVFGGIRPKMKALVISRADNKQVWSVPANSMNDMDWPLSISPDSKLLAISTDRYAESWADAFRETSHLADPGVEVRDLQTGRLVAHVRFERRTPSSVEFGLGTRFIRFVSQHAFISLAPDSTLRFYQLSSEVGHKN